MIKKLLLNANLLYSGTSLKGINLWGVFLFICFSCLHTKFQWVKVIISLGFFVIQVSSCRSDAQSPVLAEVTMILINNSLTVCIQFHPAPSSLSFGSYSVLTSWSLHMMLSCETSSEAVSTGLDFSCHLRCMHGARHATLLLYDTRSHFPMCLSNTSSLSLILQET